MPTELFLQYVKGSLMMSLVIALLLLLTPLLKKRYPARWRYAAWIIVALRLILPFDLSLPQAPVKIAVPSVSAVEPLVAAPAPAIADGEAGAPTEKPAFGDDSSYAPQETSWRMEPAAIFTAIWIAGMAVFFALQALTYLRFLRRLRYSPRGEVSAAVREQWEFSCQESGLPRAPEIAVTAGVPSPVLTGLFRPRLLLPHGGYSSREIQFIFRHELVHYRRRDLWYKLALMLANGIHWFNPLAYVMVAQANRDVELSCDDAVMTGLGAADRAGYGEAILNALPVKKKWGLEPVFTTSFGSTKKTMKRRLANLFDSTIKKRGIAALCAVVLVAATIGGMVVFSPMAAAAETETKTESRQDSTFSFDSIGAYDAVCVGRIELKSGVSYNLDVSVQEGSKWAVGLNRAGNITGYNSDGVAWNQYYGTNTEKRIQASFSGRRGESYYVYVMSTGSPLKGVKGILSTASQEGSIVPAVHSAGVSTGGGMKTAVIGEDVWYLVETEAQLRAIGQNDESLSRKYMQNADIAVTSLWTPIGSDGHPFTGVYNGNGFAVRGLQYRANERLRGLFGYAEYASLENITIVGLGTGPVVALNLDGELVDSGVVSEAEYLAAANARKAALQTVSYNGVEMRHYGDGSPYIHDVIANNTGKRIMAYERCMLAFDKDGKPLKLRWNYLSSSTVPKYSYLYDSESTEIAPGAIKDYENGGWSLFRSSGETPAEVKQVAYILYTFRSITFADGTVWTNPDYENWMKTYEGQTVSVETLENYYPHTVSVGKQP